VSDILLRIFERLFEVVDVDGNDDEMYSLEDIRGRRSVSMMI
jgi:hypothetical protein